MSRESKARPARRKRLANVGVLCCLLLGMFGVAYVGDYYHADAEAEYCMGSGDGVVVSVIDVGWYFDGPGSGKALVFYPGAKVESEAYAPIMHMLALEGIDCFLVDMPCHFAFLGTNRADKLMEEYAYDEWYLAGHSLGGAIAAIYVAGRMDQVDGLVLLAAYSTKRLVDDQFRVLSIYGSEDLVRSQEKAEAGKAYMPEDYTELCIQGGNHAQFGSYGKQRGDGEAAISRQEQQRQTVEAILAFVGE